MVVASVEGFFGINKMNRGQFMVVIIISLACLVLVAMRAQRVSLIPQEELSLYDKPTGGQVIGSLQTDGRIAVVRCEDLKHYIVPVVQIDGKDAYVVDGKFRVDRKKIWDFGSGPLSFSCS
jgi:hypothetical protein